MVEVKNEGNEKKLELCRRKKNANDDGDDDGKNGNDDNDDEDNSDKWLLCANRHCWLCCNLKYLNVFRRFGVFSPKILQKE